MFLNLNTYDSLIIIFYFVIVLFIGIFVARKQNASTDDYFFAGRNMGWLIIGLSLFTTNISSEHIMGLSGAGARSGIAVGHFEWMAIIFIICLGYIFAPIYLKKNIRTIPELIGQKFGLSTRKIFSILSIFTYIFTKVAITIFAGGFVLKEILGWDFFTSSVMMVLFTGLYTIVGGLRSVMYTQVFQAIIFLVSGALLLYFGLDSMSGVNFFEKLPEGYFSFIKPISDAEIPWLGILVGAPVIAAWYWWADQYIVQRVLSARNISEAKKGTLFAAGLKIIPFVIFIFVGIVAVNFYPSVEGNKAYSSLFHSGIFPIGIKGIIISGFFAALMSSLSSAFNSIATLIAFDFFKTREESINDAQLILVGRIVTIMLVIGSIMMIPLMEFISNNIYINLQVLQACIAPPIVAIFFLSFSNKLSKNGAIFALVVGESIGILKILNEFGFLSDNFFNGLFELNYLYFAAILIIKTIILYYVISILEKNKQINRFLSKVLHIDFGTNTN